MKNINLKSMALAVPLAFSASAMAKGMMSSADYKAGKARIAAEYKTAKAACDSLSGNASDICMADAKGKAKVAKAELNAADKPGLKADYEVSKPNK